MHSPIMMALKVLEDDLMCNADTGTGCSFFGMFSCLMYVLFGMRGLCKQLNLGTQFLPLSRLI